MGFTTISVRPETKKKLDQMKGDNSYDEFLGSMSNPAPITETMSFPREPGYKIPSLKEVHEKDRVKFDGVVTQVTISFPPGANSLVDVRVLYERPRGGTEYIVPSQKDRYIAKDDTTVTYNVIFPVSAKGNIRVEWRNTDDTYDHNVAVEVVIRKRKVGAF